eukprot:358464-Chlamydomonas_euryale.AAC.4
MRALMHACALICMHPHLAQGLQKVLRGRFVQRHDLHALALGAAQCGGNACRICRRGGCRPRRYAVSYGAVHVFKAI